MEQPVAKFPLRVIIATLAFILLCLASSIRILRDAPAHANTDPIPNLSDLRFAVLKTALPQQGVVGYIGESGNAALGQYYLAQYALAPLVVDRSTNHSLVIGNFPMAQPALPPELHLVKDFGNGVLLFANEGAR